MKTLATWLLPCLLGSLTVITVRAAEVGDYAEVTVKEAPIRSGEATLLLAKQGDKFEIVEIRDPFFGVQVTMDDGQRRKGYLWNQHSQAVPAPLAPLYTPPPPQPYVRVTAEEAAIRIEKTVLATARQGEVLLLERQQPGWFYVRSAATPNAPAGWLPAKSVQPLRHHGPSQTGIWPKSIQQATVAWADDQFIVSSPLPVAAGTDLTLEAADGRGGDVRWNGSSIEIRLADDSLLATGTKSLWVAEASGAQHRIDLPSPELSDVTSTVRYDSLPNAQYLSIELKTPAPGMWLEGCQVIIDREQPRLRRLGRERSADLSFTDIYEFKGKTYVRLCVRDFSDGLSRWVYLRAHSPWGGRSNTIVIKRVGDEFANDLTQFADQRSGPADAVAEVPSLELMPAELAQKVLETAGLQAEFVSADDFRKLSSPAPRDTVNRQGIAAGESILLGESVLLSIGRNPSINASDAANRLTIDVPDAFALASLKPFSPPQFSLDENGLQWLTDQPAATGVLALETDGGVSLNPDRSEARTHKAAFLKLMIASTLSHPPDSMPGTIGEVFRQLIAVEDKFQQRIHADQPFEIGSTADRVAKLLGADFSDADRRALEDDWGRYRRYRSSAADYDLQGNQFVADDLAIWIIQWLFDHNRYDPLQSTVPAADTQGRPLAVLFEPGKAPEWSDDVGMPITPPGLLAPPTQQVSGLIAALNQQAPPATPPESLATDPPAKGDPVVHAGDGPTQVRVPAVLRDPVSTADTKLSNLGLQIANATHLLGTDRVTASSPEARTWLDSGSGVQLQAERRVPNVLGYTPERVDQELARWNFKARRDGSAGSDDVAVRQRPEAGEFASVDAPITVNFSVLMPDLVGKLAKEGLDQLAQRDLKYRVPTKIFLQDKIISQNPAAGTLLDHGDTADLVVHAPVPSLVGRTLSDAREILDDFDLRVDAPNQLAHGEDIVRGQRPTAGDYVPHGSQVRLAPVVARVPNVVGTNLSDAETVLDVRNDFAVRTRGNLLGRDRITGQSPPAGTELERGQVVLLDARVPAPDVRGDNLASAVNRIRNAGGELSPDVLGFAQNTDLVYSQNPNPGVLVMPRSTISLTPGVNIPSVSGLSVNEARQRLANVNVNSQVTTSGTQETNNRGMAGRTVVSGQSHQGLHPRSNIGQVNLGVTEYILPVRIVPSVHGMSAVAAIAAIERADLRVNTVNVQILPRGGTRRMSVGEFRAFLLGQALSSLFGGNNSEQPRIQSANASYTRAEAGTRLVAGDNVDLYVVVTVSDDQGEYIPGK